jgi:transcriptional regulator with PAS, ATPase and Fis domain
VFLDEIGDLDPAIQVKLLRVLQTRTFQRIGDTATRRFLGKAVAATNRDLNEEMRQSRFRQDLYYRLCSDIIVTPALRDQIEGSPEQLHNLVLFIARRVAGEGEAHGLARQVEEWIATSLGPDYPWPGNVRELEQCVRNVMVRNAYQPRGGTGQAPRESFLQEVASGRLSADELLAHYCTLVYAQTRNYQETARRLGLDRRTVKSRVDESLLDQYEQP